MAVGMAVKVDTSVASIYERKRPDGSLWLAGAALVKKVKDVVGAEYGTAGTR